MGSILSTTEKVSSENTGNFDLADPRSPQNKRTPVPRHAVSRRSRTSSTTLSTSTNSVDPRSPREGRTPVITQHKKGRKHCYFFKFINFLRYY